MLAISLFCAAVGVVLGTRFKIFALGPAIVTALVTTISFGVAARWSFSEVATTLVISLVALQLGYFGSNLVSQLVYKPSSTSRAIVGSLDITFSPRAGKLT